MRHDFFLAEANHFALRTSQSVHLYTIMILILDLLSSLLWSCQLFSPPRQIDRYMQIVHGIVILLLIWRRALISSHPWPNLLFISSVENCLSLTCQSPFADCIHYTHHDIWFPHWQQNYMCTNILYFYILYIFSRFTVHAVLIMWCR